MILTDEDRALLHEVFAAARAQGWRKKYADAAHWTGPDDHEVRVYTEMGSFVVCVSEDRYHQLSTRSVVAAVDLLASIGLLPASLSSGYRAAFAMLPGKPTVPVVVSRERMAVIWATVNKLAREVTNRTGDHAEEEAFIVGLPEFGEITARQSQSGAPIAFTLVDGQKFGWSSQNLPWSVVR